MSLFRGGEQSQHPVTREQAGFSTAKPTERGKATAEKGGPLSSGRTAGVSGPGENRLRMGAASERSRSAEGSGTIAPDILRQRISGITRAEAAALWKPSPTRPAETAGSQNHPARAAERGAQLPATVNGLSREYLDAQIAEKEQRLRERAAARLRSDDRRIAGGYRPIPDASGRYHVGEDITPDGLCNGPLTISGSEMSTLRDPVRLRDIARAGFRTFQDLYTQAEIKNYRRMKEEIAGTSSSSQSSSPSGNIPAEGVRQAGRRREVFANFLDDVRGGDRGEQPEQREAVQPQVQERGVAGTSQRVSAREVWTSAGAKGPGPHEPANPPPRRGPRTTEQTPAAKIVKPGWEQPFVGEPELDKLTMQAITTHIRQHAMGLLTTSRGSEGPQVRTALAFRLSDVNNVLASANKYGKGDIFGYLNSRIGSLREQGNVEGMRRHQEAVGMLERILRGEGRTIAERLHLESEK